MLGSPNYVRFVYDGDGSDTPAGRSARVGCDRARSSPTTSTSQGLASEPTAFDGRSDYGPFIAVGIPAGGLFSGAEGIKTPEQAAIYGGTAGVAYDPCYHQACDDINNLSTKALFEMGDAAAHAVWTLAKSKTGLFPDGSRVGQTVQGRSGGAGLQGSRAGSLTWPEFGGPEGPLSLLARSIRRAAQRSTRVRIPTPWSVGLPYWRPPRTAVMRWVLKPSQCIRPT